jgi:excisionase family DNA binding protein
METITLQLPSLEEIKNQISELSLRITEIQKQSSLSKWLSNSEASDYLGVTARTLQNYRDHGILSFSKVGSKIYYKVSDIEEHLESHLQVAFNKGRRLS